MSKNRVGILIGSLREGSFSKLLANELAKMFSENNEVKLIDIEGLDYYNPDLEANVPGRWAEFRAEMKEVDSILFITPEYNRTMPAVIKNALDVGSQPAEENVWANKPGAVVSTGAGNIGGFGANHDLRQAVVFLNVLMMQSPEAYIGASHTLFDENGSLVNEGTKDFLQSFITSFEDWTSRLK